MASLAASSPVFLAGTARASAPPRRARLPRSLRPSRRASRGCARPRSVGTSFDLLSLDSGADGATRAAADAFERVDDVVMGGVSSSVIAPDLAGRDCLVWAGKCRVEGGGFTGCRSVALKSPSTSARTTASRSPAASNPTTSPSAARGSHHPHAE